MSYISLKKTFGASPILMVAEVPVLCMVLLVNRFAVPVMEMVVMRLV